MGALAEKVQVEPGQHGRKGVGIRSLAHAAVIPAYAQAIAFRAERSGDAGWQDGFEDSLGLNARGGNRFAADENVNLSRVRMDGADDQPPGAVALHLVGSENAKRVGMLSPQKQRIIAQRVGVRLTGPRWVGRARNISHLRQISASSR